MGKLKSVYYTLRISINIIWFMISTAMNKHNYEIGTYW